MRGSVCKSPPSTAREPPSTAREPPSTGRKPPSPARKPPSPAFPEGKEYIPGIVIIACLCLSFIPRRGGEVSTLPHYTCLWGTSHMALALPHRAFGRGARHLHTPLMPLFKHRLLHPPNSACGCVGDRMRLRWTSHAAALGIACGCVGHRMRPRWASHAAALERAVRHAALAPAIP